MLIIDVDHVSRGLVGDTCQVLTDLLFLCWSRGRSKQLMLGAVPSQRPSSPTNYGFGCIVGLMDLGNRLPVGYCF